MAQMNTFLSSQTGMIGTSNDRTESMATVNVYGQRPTPGGLYNTHRLTAIHWLCLFSTGRLSHRRQGVSLRKNSRLMDVVANE